MANHCAGGLTASWAQVGSVRCGTQHLHGAAPSLVFFSPSVRLHPVAQQLASRLCSFAVQMAVASGGRCCRSARAAREIHTSSLARVDLHMPPAAARTATSVQGQARWGR